MTTRKITAFILIGICTLILLRLSPYLWAFCKGIGPESDTPANPVIIGNFLSMLGLTVVGLSPMWIIGVWLLWTANRPKKPAATAAYSAPDEPGAWPPLPTIPGS